LAIRFNLVFLVSWDWNTGLTVYRLLLVLIGGRLSGSLIPPNFMLTALGLMSGGYFNLINYQKKGVEGENWGVIIERG